MLYVLQASKIVINEPREQKHFKYKPYVHIKIPHSLPSRGKVPLN